MPVACCKCLLNFNNFSKGLVRTNPFLLHTKQQNGEKSRIRGTTSEEFDYFPKSDSAAESEKIGANFECRGGFLYVRRKIFLTIRHKLTIISSRYLHKRNPDSSLFRIIRMNLLI
jgi:hypothetical protein